MIFREKTYKAQIQARPTILESAIERPYLCGTLDEVGRFLRKVFHTKLHRDWLPRLQLLLGYLKCKNCKPGCNDP